MLSPPFSVLREPHVAHEHVTVSVTLSASYLTIYSLVLAVNMISHLPLGFFYSIIPLTFKKTISFLQLLPMPPPASLYSFYLHWLQAHPKQTLTRKLGKVISSLPLCFTPLQKVLGHELPPSRALLRYGWQIKIICIYIYI